MPLCAALNADGALVVQGSVTDTTTCSYVVFTGAEASVLQASPFNLSLSQGAVIGGSILTLWGMAYAFKSLARLLNHSSEE
jgi:hypothetical protein